MDQEPKKSTMVDFSKPPNMNGEYEHFVLGNSLHYGRHARFGRHVAIGDGPNSIHIYENRLHIGGRGGQPVYMTPEQSMIARRVLARFEALAKDGKGRGLKVEPREGAE